MIFKIFTAAPRIKNPNALLAHSFFNPLLFLSNCLCFAVLAVTVITATNSYAIDAQKIDAPHDESITNGTQQPINISRLDSRAFLQQLITSNLEVQYSRLNTSVTGHLGSAEASIYVPTFFSNLHKENRYRQRTIQEIRITNSGTYILDEKVNSLESGVRSKLPTGAELSLSYKRSNTNNNLIQQNSLGIFNTEYSGLLNLNLKQPLLKNSGRSVTETDKKIAELEYQAALQQLTQQTFKTSIDGLNLYWQLHRAQETVKFRRDAVSTSKALLTDAQSRVTAGKTPQSAILELNGTVLNREAELMRSMQGLREAQSKLLTALNVLWSNDTPAVTDPVLHPSDLNISETQYTLDDLLMLWPPYQIALVRKQQAVVRLNFARNQKKPLLDFVMSYSNTGLAYSPTDAKQTTLSGKYPDWYVGLNFEYPIDGNQKAQEQFLAQMTRLEQSELELLAIRNGFINDVGVRLDDMKNARSVLKLSDSEVKLRLSIFENERIRVRLGVGLIGNLIQKQSELIEAQQRLVENQTRYEIALVTWQYTRGNLLTDNGIVITNAATVLN